ncbi:MAG: hypothetical protein PVJ38_06295 [Candidatus Bathyarchaeota archaeon]
MTGRLVTEILNLDSLQNLQSRLEVEVDYYLSQKEEISERLGSFLRETEEEYGDEEWFKRLDLEKLGKSSKKGKKSKDSNWVQFKSIELSSSLQGEAEVMFEALSKITEKLEALNSAKESIDELKKVGLGNEICYVCYLEDGVLMRIALRPLNSETEDKFSFNRGFTIIQAIHS